MSGTYNQRSGFTFFELVVAIAVLAIIATIALPRLGQRKPRAVRQQVIEQLSALVTLGYIRALETGKAQRVFFDLKKQHVQLEQQVLQQKRTSTVQPARFEPVQGAFITTRLQWPEHLEIKQFYIKRRDELRTGAGSETNTVWFYIAPSGIAQEVIINTTDTHELDSAGLPVQMSLVLNPFSLQFTVYDAFQHPS